MGSTQFSKLHYMLYSHELKDRLSFSAATGVTARSTGSLQLPEQMLKREAGATVDTRSIEDPLYRLPISKPTL